MPMSDEAARALFRRSESLRHQLYAPAIAAPQKQSIREQLVNAYSQLLEEAPSVAIEQNVEVNLWKDCFYRPIEEIRRRLARRSHGNAAKAERLTRSLFDHINRAITFYSRWLKRNQRQIPSCSRARASCVQTLIYLGDLHRYKQLANPNPSDRDWSKCFRIYHLAAMIDPRQGNAYNQMAVVEGYWRNDIAAVAHYCLSIAVQCPFDTASRNLQVLFSQARRRADQFFKRASSTMPLPNTPSLDQVIRRMEDSQWPDMHRILLWLFGTLYDGAKRLNSDLNRLLAMMTGSMPTIVEALDRMLFARMRQHVHDDDKQSRFASSIVEMIFIGMFLVHQSPAGLCRSLSTVFTLSIATLAAKSCTSGNWHLLSVAGVCCDFIGQGGISLEMSIPSEENRQHWAQLEQATRISFWDAISRCANRIRASVEEVNASELHGQFLREQIDLSGVKFLAKAYSECDAAIQKCPASFDLQEFAILNSLELSSKELQVRARGTKILQFVRMISSSPTSPVMCNPVNGEFSGRKSDSFAQSSFLGKGPVLDADSIASSVVDSVVNAGNASNCGPTASPITAAAQQDRQESIEGEDGEVIMYLPRSSRVLQSSANLLPQNRSPGNPESTASVQPVAEADSYSLFGNDRSGGSRLQLPLGGPSNDLNFSTSSSPDVSGFRRVQPSSLSRTFSAGRYEYPNNSRSEHRNLLDDLHQNSTPVPCESSRCHTDRLAPAPSAPAPAPAPAPVPSPWANNSATLPFNAGSTSSFTAPRMPCFGAAPLAPRPMYPPSQFGASRPPQHIPAQAHHSTLPWTWCDQSSGAGFGRMAVPAQYMQAPPPGAFVHHGTYSAPVAPMNESVTGYGPRAVGE